VGFPVTMDDPATMADHGATTPGGPLEELRRELEEAQDTLRSVRAGPYRLLVEGMAKGVLSYFRAVAADFDGTLAESWVAPDTAWPRSPKHAHGESG
jgi:hypothetical protein